MTDHEAFTQWFQQHQYDAIPCNVGKEDERLAMMRWSWLNACTWARQAQREVDALLADEATLSDPACSQDGGCEHRECVTARMIATAIRSQYEK